MKTKTVLVLLAALGGAMFVSLVLCAGGLYLFFRGASADVAPRIDELLAALATGDVAASYERDTTREFKQVTTSQQYQQIADVVRTRLGGLRSKITTSLNLRNHNGRSYVEVSYNAEFEKGPGTIQATLEKVDGQWRFMKFHVQSPILQQPLVCSHCGAQQPLGAKFCPACGREVTKP